MWFVNRKYPLEQLCSVKRLTVWFLTRRDYSKNRDAHAFPASVRPSSVGDRNP